MKILKNFVLMALLVLPIIVSAESIKDGDTMYVLEERKVTCLKKDDYPVTTDKEGLLVLHNNVENYYVKINEKNECVKLTEEEIKEVESIGYGSMPYYIAQDDNGKYFVYIAESNYEEEAYILTIDTEVANKSYYMVNEKGDEVIVVSSPVKEELSKYYEREFLKSAKGEKFNESLTYYTKTNSTLNIYGKVESPKAEEVDSYYYIPEKPYTEIPFDVLNQEKYLELLDKYQTVDQAIRLSENEFLIKAYTYKSGEKNPYDVYKTNGEKIEFLSNVRSINKMANGLLIVMKEDSIEFYNSSLKKLFTIESDNLDENNLSYKNHAFDYGYQNHVQYIVKDDIITGDLSFYTIRDYKVLDGLNQTYKDGDLTFRFSGVLEKVSKVLVNNVELNKENYTLTSGSTIVTLKKDYLDTLKSGDYTLKVEYNDGGSSEATFKVESVAASIPGTPNTYDGITIAVVGALISLIGVAVGIVCIKKSNKQK